MWVLLPAAPHTPAHAEKHKERWMQEPHPVSAGTTQHRWGLGGSRWAVGEGHPPVDAPLRVDLEDGGILRVVVLHLRVGELSAVDVDDNGGTAGALPRGRQTPDFSRIPPREARRGGEDTGVGLVYKIGSIAWLCHQQRYSQGTGTSWASHAHL